MKFSIRYANGVNATKDADEVIFNVTPENLAEIALIIKEMPDWQSAVLAFTYKKEWDNNWQQTLNILSDLSHIHSLMSVRLPVLLKDVAIDLREHNINYFFLNFCSTWDDLITTIQYGVCSIYITNELGFDLENVKAVCGKDVKVRAYANVAQHGGVIKDVDSIYSFFIRPEDLPIIEDYIDVIEFICDNDKIDTYYNIYKKGRFEGNLKNLIVDFNQDIQNDAIIPFFTKARVSCGKTCFKNNKCKVCQNAIGLSNELSRMGVKIGLEHK